MAKCKYCDMRIIAQGDEGCWGKELYCTKMRDEYDDVRLCQSNPIDCPDAVLVNKTNEEVC